MDTRLSPAELEELRAAKARLENPSLAARISEVVGAPIERGFELLPKSWSAVAKDAVHGAIEKALDVAIWSMGDRKPRASSDRWHKLAVITTGAAGGALGLSALSIELPISTALILRSIADIARAEGEDLASAETKVQCIQVLALGGRSPRDDAAEAGYFAARAAMARAVSEAAAYIADKGLTTGGPALVRLIAQVASRFSVTVTEKAAAQAVPVIGAFGGAVLNSLFIDHFQDVARGHFTVRRLERAHGADEVERAYATLRV
ncbi:MAG TPA: EcsC family protein [Gammaproteobacteria bacterium]|nr:EcsC family protein [Gammaproteobacteria bacterium]